jgi:serine/threonine protein kinase
LHPQALFIIASGDDQVPTLKKPEQWSSLFRDFIAVCLVRDPDKRYTAQQLLNVFASLISASDNECAS